MLFTQLSYRMLPWASLIGGADVGGAAPDELAHQHLSQEHGVGVAVGFAVVVGVCSIPGKVAPYKDTKGRACGRKRRAHFCQQGKTYSLYPPCSCFYRFFLMKGFRGIMKL